MKTARETYTADEQKSRTYERVHGNLGRSEAGPAHLVAPDKRYIAPSTFPNTHTPQQYAEDHGKLMKAIGACAGKHATKVALKPAFERAE